MSIVTTTTAIAVGMLPFAIAGGIAGNEIVRPMADAIIGGDIATALLAVFVLPVLYLRFAPVSVPELETTELVVVPELEDVSETSN